MDDFVSKLGFLARNAKRAYPLEHTATRRDSQNNQLPDGVIVDLSFRYDKTSGSNPFISYITVTNLLYSCGIALETPAGPRLVAHVVAKKTDAWTTVPLNTLVNGAAGSIVFGDVNDFLSLTFTSATQTGLLPSVAKAIPAGFLTDVTVGQFESLAGTIELRAGQGVTLRTSPVFKTATSEDIEATAIIIGLDRAIANTDLLTACARRPESNNCGTGEIALPAVETINDIRVGCGRTIDIEVVGGTISPSTGGLSLRYTPTIAQMCSDRVRNPNIAAVLDECQRPPVIVENCEPLPAYYDLKIQSKNEDRWQKNWFWQYGDDSYTLSDRGLSATVQTVENASFTNMVGVYDNCWYRVCGDHVLELDIVVPAINTLLPTVGRCGVLLNYMQNAWLYSVLAGDAVVDPGLRVGLEIRQRELPTDVSPGVYELWLCNYKNETDIINSAYVSLLREDEIFQYKLRIELLVTVWEREIPIKTLCRSQLFPLNVTTPAMPDALETPLTFFGPYVGKYGVYADNTQFQIETFRLSEYVAGGVDS